MNKLVNLIKRKGYHNTFKILAFSDRYQLPLKDFLSELSDFSNHNSYYRIKDTLIENKLIEEIRINATKKIRATDKGIFLYQRLMEISNILE